MRSRMLIIAALVSAAVAGTAAEEASAQAPTVTATGSNTFALSTSSVSVAQPVTFMNGSGNHNVHFVGEPTGTPDPANMTAWSFQRAFATAGAVTFYCDIHGSPTTGMRATLNVVAAPVTVPAPTPVTPAPTPVPTTPAVDLTAPSVTRLTKSITLARAIVRFRLAEAAEVTARLRRRGTTRTLKRVTRNLPAGAGHVTLRKSLTARRRYQVALRIKDAAGNVTNRTVSFTAPRS